MVLLLDGGVGHEWKKAHGDASFLGGARVRDRPGADRRPFSFS